MINNITVDTGKGIARFDVGDKIVFTDNLNNKTYEEVKLIKIVDNYDCLIETEKRIRYYTSKQIISYDIVR